MDGWIRGYVGGGGVGWGGLLREGVRIAQRPSVEIFRDALPSRLVLERAAFAGDGEEGHEARFVEVTGWILR